MRSARGRLLLLVATVLLCSALPAVAEINLAAYRNLSDCDAALDLYSEEVDVCHCYVNLADRERSWGAVLDHLAGRIRVVGDDPRLTYAIGLVEKSRSGPRAEERFLEAADLFAAQRWPEGEVQALLSLFYSRQEESRRAEADESLARAERVAEAAGDRELRLFVLYHRGVQAVDRGDFVESTRLYREVEAGVFPDGHPLLQSFVLSALGAQAYYEARFEEGIRRFRQAAGIMERIGDYSRAARLRYWIADKTDDLHARGGATREEAERARNEAIESATRGRNRLVQLSLLQDSANEPGLPTSEKITRQQAALDMALRVRKLDTAAQLYRSLANYSLNLGPERYADAVRLADEAIQLSRSAALRIDEVYGYVARALLHRRAGLRDMALADWNRALDCIEALRDQQREDLVQARQTHRWAFTYYRLMDYILESPEVRPAPAEIDRALRVAERLRSRRSLETLDDAAASSTPEGELSRLRSETLVSLSRLQRSLGQKDLTEAEQRRILVELARLEAEEASLRARLARSDPGFASLRAPEFASIERTMEALAADEAVLSFHIGPEPNVAPFLIVITRAGTSLHRLPPTPRIESAISLLLGLLERRDGSEATAAAALHGMLLSEASAALPPAIRRIIVIPEGPLHRLPMDLLQDGREGVSLGERFDISLSPSVTSWLEWRQRETSVAPLPLLALADPAFSGDAAAGVARSRSGAANAREYGRLPMARGEAATAARRLGSGARIVEGREASERFLKGIDLQKYEVLHIAAHAVLDDQHPERSAILLAPGGPDEDGLLQIREIVGLDLRDRVVVLSACSSGAGTVLQGAGVMGIARGFFQAGARAVVGSLLPLRDDEAADAMARFANHLGKGASVAGSLAAARREMAALGAPPAAWAGLVALGDGDLVPFPGGSKAGMSLASPASVAALLTALGWLVWRRGRRRSTPAR